MFKNLKKVNMTVEKSQKGANVTEFLKASYWLTKHL